MTKYQEGGAVLENQNVATSDVKKGPCKPQKIVQLSNSTYASSVRRDGAKDCVKNSKWYALSIE